jgi:hypothetical protein
MNEMQFACPEVMLRSFIQQDIKHGNLRVTKVYEKFVLHLGISFVTMGYEYKINSLTKKSSYFLSIIESYWPVKQ